MTDPRHPADLSAMSNTQHTAGPWTLTLDPAFPAELAIDAIVDGRTVHIALVHGVGTDEETQANASLILAAPELLAALKGVVRVADRKTDEFDAARAAIAAAEGK